MTTMMRMRTGLQDVMYSTRRSTRYWTTCTHTLERFIMMQDDGRQEKSRRGRETKNSASNTNRSKSTPSSCFVRKQGSRDYEDVDAYLSGLEEVLLGKGRGDQRRQQPNTGIVRLIVDDVVGVVMDRLPDSLPATGWNPSNPLGSPDITYLSLTSDAQMDSVSPTAATVEHNTAPWCYLPLSYAHPSPETTYPLTHPTDLHPTCLLSPCEGPAAGSAPEAPLSLQYRST
ncbi:hypothetical protein V8D89_013856 [Ganoderma adspersum]